MKKFLFGLIASVLLTNFSFGQNFRTEGKGTIVESTIIESNSNSVIVKVDVTNSETKVTLPSFYYKFQSDSKSNLIEDIKKDPKAVSGTFTIVVDGELAYIKKVVNGDFTESQTFDFEGTSELGKKNPCTVKGQIDCINKKLDNMNWVEYGFCLATAPECYAMLNASCIWDNCHK